MQVKDKRYTRVFRIGRDRVEVDYTDPTQVEVRAPQALANRVIAIRFQGRRKSLKTLLELRRTVTGARGCVWLPTSLPADAELVAVELVSLADLVSRN